LTTRALVADYLGLCRNPLKDIRRWIAETTPKTKSAHAQGSSSRLGRRTDRFRPHPLHEMRSRLDASRQGRSQNYRLSSRPGAGVDQYDRLRSLRAEGGPASASAQSCAETTGEITPPTCFGEEADAPDCEVSGIRAFYAALIAAARSSLPRAAAAALVQRLRTEKIMATRAAKDRLHARRANQHNIRKLTHAPPASSYPKRQFG
jgi:hypothetical protein